MMMCGPTSDRSMSRLSTGGLDDWAGDSMGALALIILLDQAPRNMFRDDARAFATDALARDVTNKALAEGFDGDLPEVMQVFLLLPLEHSEDLGDQERCVELMSRFKDRGFLDYAVQHRDIIARFGRFPHRNEMLGRASTPEEVEFLTQPGSSF